MKRYNFYPLADRGMVEVDEGMFCIYSDHEKEIKKLKQDCKNLVDINNNQAVIVKLADEEIKKLRDVLKEIDYYVNVIPENRHEIRRFNPIRVILQEALKESE